MKIAILTALLLAVVAMASPDSGRVTLETDVATLELIKSQLGPKSYRPLYSSPYFRSRPYYGAYPFYRSYNQFYPYAPYYYDPSYVPQPYQQYQNEARVPSATDEAQNDEDALNNLKALKEIYEKSDSDKRLLISSISVNSDLSSITIKTTSFLSLLSSLTSLTIQVTTKTVLVPGLTVG